MVNDINQICINFLLKILFIKFNNENKHHNRNKKSYLRWELKAKVVKFKLIS